MQFSSFRASKAFVSVSSQNETVLRILGVKGQIFFSFLLCLLVQMFVLNYVTKSFSYSHLKSVLLYDSCEEWNGIRIGKMEIFFFFFFV